MTTGDFDRGVRVTLGPGQPPEIFPWPQAFTIGRGAKAHGPDAAIVDGRGNPIEDVNLSRRLLRLEVDESFAEWRLVNVGRANHRVYVELHVNEGTPNVAAGSNTLWPGASQLIGRSSKAVISLDQPYEVGFETLHPAGQDLGPSSETLSKVTQISRFGQLQEVLETRRRLIGELGGVLGFADRSEVSAHFARMGLELTDRQFGRLAVSASIDDIFDPEWVNAVNRTTVVATAGWRMLRRRDPEVSWSKVHHLLRRCDLTDVKERGLSNAVRRLIRTLESEYAGDPMFLLASTQRNLAWPFGWSTEPFVQFMDDYLERYHVDLCRRLDAELASGD